MIQVLKIVIALIPVLLLLPAEGLTQGQHSDKIISGTVSGFDCAVVGVLCPTTHRSADYTTGVFTDDNEFYFIVNIPQSFLQQYFRETVEVEGVVYDPYQKAVEPEIIYLIEDRGRRLVYESGYLIDKNNRRATFQEGVFKNGEWLVGQEQAENFIPPKEQGGWL